jgi:hypothetical protein
MSPAIRKPKPRRAAALPYWLREFALIRLQVTAFVLTVAVAVGAVSASRWYWHQARDFQAWAQQKRNAARDRLFNAETEKREIRLYQPQYAALRERGLIGQENRLDWVDAIRQIQEQRKLMPISYELEPQQPVRMDAGMELGGYRLHGSRMNLHMDLLHEGDLFVLLDDLRQRSFYSAQDCSIKRAASGLPAPLAPTLSADCTLNWLTLTPAPAPRIAQQWRPQ